MTVSPVSPRSAPMHLVGFGTGFSAALVVLFVLCWIVAFATPGIVSAPWITLFTTAPVGSLRAIIEGVIWSIVFGWIIAAVMVPIYNRILST